MAEAPTETSEIQLKEINSSSSVELETSVDLTDLHNEAGMSKLSEALETAKGRCLIAVHPFYTFKYLLNKDEESNAINSPGNEKVKDYISKLGVLIRKFEEQDIPIIFMQDAETG